MNFEDVYVPLVEFMYLVFTCMSSESYRMRLGSFLLCLSDVFRAFINSLAGSVQSALIKLPLIFLILILMRIVNAIRRHGPILGHRTRGEHSMF